MGTIISDVQAQKVRRCSRIVINAPYGEQQTIMQEYEDVSVVDGEAVAKAQSAVYNYSIADLVGIDITVNGKQITGADVLGFFLYFNDHREECLGIVS